MERRRLGGEQLDRRVLVRHLVVGPILGRPVLGRLELVGQVVGRQVMGRQVMGRPVVGRNRVDRQVVGRQVLGRQVMGVGGLSETETDSSDQLSPESAGTRRLGAGVQVWTLIAAITVAAAALIGLRVTDLWSPPDLPGHPGWVLVLLVLGFAVAELSVVYLPIGRNAHSLTLNEIPLVVGLFIMPPTHYVLARVLGAAVPLAWRNRRSLRKLAFNLAQYALEAATVVVLYQLVLGDAAPLSPRGWLAVGAAVVTSDLLGTLLITLVIAAHTGTRPQLEREVIQFGPLGPLVNASFALVLVYVVTVDWRAVWTVGVVVGVLALAQRSQHNLRRRTESLEQLGRFTGEMGASSTSTRPHRPRSRGSAMASRRRSWSSTLTEDFAGRATPLAHPFDGPVVESSDAGLAAASRRGCTKAAAGGSSDPRPRPGGHPSRGRPGSVLAMPLRGDDGVIGALLVGDRLGDVETFTRSDLRELEAVGNHLSVALRNARRADLIREQTEEQLRRSLHDELTGLPNRRHLDHALSEHLLAGGQASAILLDLDRFKDINDTLGHHTGDALLRMVADRLRAPLPADALVARLGGDEFAVLLLSGDEAASASVAAMVRHAFTLPFELDQLQVTVEASLGVAATGPDADSGDLLRQADIAMYAAKTRRTGVEVYRRELEAGSPQRLTVLTELRNAIAHGELTVHFQPKVRLSTVR